MVREAHPRVADWPTAASAYWAWAKRWRPEAPKAVACLERDLEHLLSFLDCPPGHQRMVRTTNAIERCFREVRRPTRPMSCFNNPPQADQLRKDHLCRLQPPQPQLGREAPPSIYIQLVTLPLRGLSARASRRARASAACALSLGRQDRELGVIGRVRAQFIGGLRHGLFRREPLAGQQFQQPFGRSVGEAG